MKRAILDIDGSPVQLMLFTEPGDNVPKVLDYEDNSYRLIYDKVPVPIKYDDQEEQTFASAALYSPGGTNGVQVETLAL